MKKPHKKLRLGGISRAFSDQNFRHYSIGAIATWIGYFVQLIAISWHTWELTQSPFWLATIALLDLLPNILLAPLAGAIADRHDKYKLMGLTSLLALIQASLIALLASNDQLTLLPLSILVLVHGIIISFMVPAMYGILPRFVKRNRLASAIAVSSSYAQLAVFLGPAIAGWIITQYGLTTAFVTNALCYLIYLITWRNLKTPITFKHPSPSHQPLLKDIKTGITYLLTHKGIAPTLILLLAGDSLAAGIFFMTPAFADQILNQGIIGVSLILSAKGLGATLAAIYIAYQGEQAAHPQKLLTSFLLFLICTYIIYLANTPLIILVAFILLGLALETFHTVMLTLIQLTITEQQRGRVMSTLFMLGQLASAIGTYLIGYYATTYGLITPTLTTATLCLIVWLIYFTKRKTLINTLKIPSNKS